MPDHSFLCSPFLLQTEDEISDRLFDFYRSLVAKRQAQRQPSLPIELPDEAEKTAHAPVIPVPLRVRGQIRARAKRLRQLRDQAAGISRLSEGDLRQLRAVGGGARLAGPRDEHALDVLAAQLFEEMPWMQPAILSIWQLMKAAAAAGQSPLALPPILLNGPPGVGKSYFARRLATLCQAPSETIEVGSGQSAFRIAGLEQGWSSAMPGRPVQLILRTGVSNPVIVLDELCKAQPAGDRAGVAGLQDSLLSLLEPATSAHWMCPYFHVAFDMSKISWIMTSNTLATIPEPLLSRVRVIDLPALRNKDLLAFAKAECKRRSLSDPARKAVLRAIRTVDAPRRDLSLRGVVRLVDRAEIAEQRPLLH